MFKVVTGFHILELSRLPIEELQDLLPVTVGSVERCEVNLKSRINLTEYTELWSSGFTCKVRR